MGTRTKEILIGGLSRRVGSCVAAVGVSVLVAWWAGIPLLAGGFAGLAPVRANTGFGFILAGAALALLASPSLRARRSSLVLFGLATLLGLATAIESVWGLDLKIDALITDLIGVAVAEPRMAPAAMLEFILLGTAGMLLARKSAPVVAQSLTVAGFALAYFGLLGYAFSGWHSGAIGNLSATALVSALSFAALSFGLFFSRPTEGVTRTLLAPGLVGSLARRLGPPVLVVPAFLGWLRLLGEQAGLYDTPTGVALLVVSTTLLLGGLLAWALATLERSETQREAGVKALRASELRYSTLFHTAPLSLTMTDLTTGVIVDANDAAAELFGFPREELIGHSAAELALWVDPAWRAGLIERLASTHRIVGEETRFRRKDGSVRDGLVAAEIVETVSGRGLIGVVADVTERNRHATELAAKTAALERSNAELERFAYVASHDLQEPLRMVSSYAELLDESLRDKLAGEEREFLAFAVDGARRMQQMIDGLLEYSRITTRATPPEPTDAEAALAGALANLEATIEENHAIVKHGPLPRVLADPVQLARVFQNLVANGIKFHGDAAPVVEIAAHRDGSVCVFSVRDNGIGIDPEGTKQLFQMFRRLESRRKYPGSGMGLAISKRIVERHGGRMWVESRVGAGSTFFFTLPEAMEVASVGQRT